MKGPTVAKRRKYSEDEQLAQDLANALTELPDNWIMCRDMRHAWKTHEDFHVAQVSGSKVGEVRRILICMRCETLRIEKYHLATWGLEKYSQHYAYPDNYQIHGVPRGVKPSNIIQGEQYRRTMVRLTEAKRRSRKSA